MLADAQQKCEVEWPEEEAEEDPAFQKMWDELGGNKVTKRVEVKQVKVEIQRS